MPEKPSEPTVPDSRKQLITLWTSRILRAKKRWESDFKRMKANEEFVTGIQYDDQENMTTPKYVANFTLRLIAQKVATLYAKNPEAVSYRRKRLDFAVWDGNVETLIQAAQQVQMAIMGGQPPAMEAWAVLMDYERGKENQQKIELVGKTLEIVYQYQCDTQDPEFKVQMKQLVRRVCTCGVGYVRLNFQREYEDGLETSTGSTSTPALLKRAREIMERLEEGDLQSTSPEWEELQILLGAIQRSTAAHEEVRMNERLVFDFPPATSIIPDERCKDIRLFTGAHWIVQEYLFPADFIRGYFEKDVTNKAKAYNLTDDAKREPTDATVSQNPAPDVFRVWNVIDKDTKSEFFICEGYEDYLQEPTAVEPVTRRFWPIFPLVFNAIEVENESKASIFPPSDVDLIRSAQKEHNRIRESLKRHRVANRPTYIAAKNTLEAEDKLALIESEDNDVVEISNVTPGADVSKLVSALPKVGLDPLVYDTNPQQQDALITTGAQEANLGPAQPDVTATVGTIAEQSRITGASSNVDDLDDFLTELAEAGGETCLRYMSRATVQHIVGPGAVWPEIDRDDYLNELLLKVVAASSGRPNKAIEIANWERLAPLLLQAGANVQAIIRETVKRANDQLDPEEFFPVPGLGMPSPVPTGGGASVSPAQPLQALPSGSPVPLAGA